MVGLVRVAGKIPSSVCPEIAITVLQHGGDRHSRRLGAENPLPQGDRNKAGGNGDLCFGRGEAPFRTDEESTALGASAEAVREVVSVLSA